MAIVRGAPGAVAFSAFNGSSVSVAYPSGNSAGDKLVLIIGMKPSTADSGSVTTPTGWTLVTSITGQGAFGTTLGNDTGNTNLFVFERIVPAGGLTGSLAVTVTTNNICWGYMERLTTDLRGWQNSVGTAGGDNNPGVAFTVAFGTDPGVKAGDLILVSVCIPTDLNAGAQFSGQTLTQAGITFGTFVETSEPFTNAGNDIAGWNGYVPVSTGASTGAPTLNLTASGTISNVRGPATFVRVRDAHLLVAEQNPFTIGGQAATLTKASGTNKNLQGETGSFALTGKTATVARNRVLVGATGSLTFSGNAATIARGRKLSGQLGTVNVTGVDAGVRLGRYASAAAGSFAIAGQAATLTKVNLYALDSQPANFTYTGQAATLVHVRALQLAADAATFTATGQSATLTKLRAVALDAQPASFAVAGQSASLIYTQTRSLNAEAGVFALAGQIADLNVLDTFEVSGEPGTYASTGQAAQIKRSRVIETTGGSYSALGQVAQLRRSRLLNAGAGSASLSGQSATLAKGRVLQVQPGSWAISGGAAQLLHHRSLSTELGSYAWQGVLAQMLFGRLVLSASGSYSIEGQESTALVAVAFELVNPHLVHIQARPRHTREQRLTFFHQSPRSRVIHEAVQ